jgi:hypothetical protein
MKEERHQFRRRQGLDGLSQPHIIAYEAAPGLNGE